MSARIWQAIDTAAHKLKLPKPLRRPICDRFDLSLGVTRDELYRTEGSASATNSTPTPAEAVRLRQAREDAREGRVTSRDAGEFAEFGTTEAQIDAMVAGADPDETFYEEDEPVENVLAAFDRGVKGVTGKPERRDGDA